MEQKCRKMDEAK